MCCLDAQTFEVVGERRILKYYGLHRMRGVISGNHGPCRVGGGDARSFYVVPYCEGDCDASLLVIIVLSSASPFYYELWRLLFCFFACSGGEGEVHVA